MFTTTTKQNPDPEQGLAGLAAAVREAAGSAGSPPLVAIGGIAAGDAAAIYQAGAHAICAIRAVNDAADPGFAARQFEPASHA
jgi:thiamine-phosphate pyrophosphorylase